MTELRASEFRLGDVVQLFDGPYGTATVRQIENDVVTFFRPYVQSEDWSYTGGVICTIGIEQFESFGSGTYKVWHRGNVDQKRNAA